MYKKLITLALILIISGCSVKSESKYNTLKKPISEMAVLIPGLKNCQIEAIDYETIHLALNKEIHLIPGNHTIQVEYTLDNTANNHFEKQFATLQQDFAPGRVYVIREKRYTSDHPKLKNMVLSELFIEKEGTFEQFATFHPNQVPTTAHWRALRNAAERIDTLASKPSVRAY